MIHNRRTPRLYIRLGSLILAILSVCPVPLWIYHSKILVQASPFVAVCILLAGGTLGPGSILGLGFLIVVILRKRWFCRYICPVGLILDGVSGIGLKKNAWWKKCPSIGKYIVLVTVAGAVTGYPLLLWTDPLVFFNSAFSVYTASSALPGILSIAGLAVLLLLSIFAGSLWCARICPLGATQDFLAGIKSLLQNLKKRVTEENTQQKTGIEGTFPVTRRTLLALAAGAGLGLWAERNGFARTMSQTLRPPGAIKEDVFTGECVRCCNCIRVCPTEIIQPDTGKAGIWGFMSPVLSYKKGYCLETCNDCTKVCPSGALKKLTLDNKGKYIIGEAVLSPSLCFLVRGVNDCDICVRSCPFEAIQVYWDEDSYIAYPVIDAGKCNGCGACERFCPTGNVKAINVRNILKIK